MTFRTELYPKDSGINITYNDQLLLVGSCFSENIGHRLSQFKYSTVVNPLGIIYHPKPLHNLLKDAANDIRVSEKDLIQNIDGKYIAWNIHSRLSTTNVQESLANINNGMAKLRSSLIHADYIFLTYGTAYYYHHKEFGTVANCHKFPSSHFDKKLSTSAELLDDFNDLLSTITTINQKAKILLTISPVRHIKDGIIENSRSKAALITTAHSICEQHLNCHYLPSYELLIDDLRDYRFYADDMVHPTAKAIDYVWSKISPIILDLSESKLRASIQKLIAAAAHRPFNPNSQEHQKFMASQKLAVEQILADYPSLDFSEELKAFDL